MPAAKLLRPDYHHANCVSESSSGLRNINFRTPTFTSDRVNPGRRLSLMTEPCFAARKTIVTRSKKLSHLRGHLFPERRKIRGLRHWPEFANILNSLFNISLPVNAKFCPKGGE